jgi:hypothetical protein
MRNKTGEVPSVGLRSGALWTTLLGLDEPSRL